MSLGRLSGLLFVFIVAHSGFLGLEAMGKRLGFLVVRAMDSVDRVLVVIAQLLLIAMVTVTFFSVFGRTFFNKTVPDDLLIMELLMVALVFLPLGYVQSIGAHIEVTVLSDLFPKRVQSILVALGLLLGVVVFGWMAYVGWLNAYSSYQLGEYGDSSVLYLPIWPAKMLIPVGLGWWCLRMLAQLMIPAARVKADTEAQQALRETEYLSESRPNQATDGSTVA